MIEINEYITAEFENVERLLRQLPSEVSLSNLSGLELSGTAAILHGFYNGVENILKQVARYKGHRIPEGSSWHKDLITLAVAGSIISQASADTLKGYLAFRHFFSHAYTFDLDKDRIMPLVRSISEVFARIRREIQNCLRT